MKLTKSQKVLIDRDLNTSNYLYNKTIHFIKEKKYSPYKDKDLRDLLVTNITQKNNSEYSRFTKIIGRLKKNKASIDKENKKLINSFKKKKILSIVIKYIYNEYKISKIKQDLDLYSEEFKQSKKSMKKEINPIINNWELLTHKDIRTGAVKTACTSYKSAISNLINGNITKFDVGYRKKKHFGKSMVYSKSMIKLKSDGLYFSSRQLNKRDKKIHVGNKTFKKIKKMNLSIEHDLKIVKTKSNYYLHIPIKLVDNDLPKTKKIIGIDPGVCTALTGFDGDNTMVEYNINRDLIDKLDKKISRYKEERKKKRSKRARKRTLNKFEKKKSNLINEFHWKSIRSLLTDYDYVLLGKLDSQGFVKNGKNPNLNRDTNNLKPYLFRQRLIFKAFELNKYVKIIDEHHTTKTCSTCGSKNDPKKLRIYHCSKCNHTYGRDLNAAKNILMKGILD